VKVSLSLIIRKRIWYKRVFVSRCTLTNCWVFVSRSQTAGYFSVSLVSAPVKDNEARETRKLSVWTTCYIY